MPRVPDAVDDFFTAIAPATPAAPSPRAYLDAIAARLRGFRAHRGLSRRALAERSGISERYIARMEGGTGNASLLVLRAIAGALGIAPADLLADRDEAATTLDRLLARLTPAQKQEAHALLARHFSAGQPRRPARDPGRPG